jgi:5-methylcytosine-specific restriction endonuclease McrA
MVNRICEFCNTEYQPKTSWQKTCSYECGYRMQNAKKPKKINEKKCMRCNASLTHKKSHAIYCSKTCKAMDHNFKHRANTRVHGVARRMAIIERDNFTCYMCNVKLEVDKIELDHLIPTSKNGSSSDENLSVSCMPCNRSRGNRISEKQIIKIQQIKVSV